MHTRTDTGLTREDEYHSEQVVLGVLLTYPDQITRVRQQLPAEAFHDPLHRDLFLSLCAIADAGNDAFTYAAIGRELEKRGSRSQDLMDQLRRLMESGSAPGVLGYDLAAVREAFERRSAVLALEQTLHELRHDRIAPVDALHRPALHYEKLGARALRGASGSATGLRFVTLGQLEPAAQPDWVWPGYAAMGSITLLSAAPKAGKSTLLRSLLRDLYRGGPLAGAERLDRPTLIISEESGDQWARQTEPLGLPRDLIHLCAQPFFAKPSGPEWERLIARVVESVRELAPRLVIFDTLSNLWPVRDENSAAEVNAALMPLRAISQAGPALILVHHDRKSGGSHGEGARGSSALGGFPEALVQLRRYRDDPYETRRRLSYVGRFDGTHPEAILDWEDDRYRVIGTRHATGEAGLIDRILELLKTETGGLDAQQIHQRLGDTSIDTVRRALKKGSEAGRWTTTGSGFRADPRLFHARREKESSAPVEPAGTSPDGMHA